MARQRQKERLWLEGALYDYIKEGCPHSGRSRQAIYDRFLYPRTSASDDAGWGRFYCYTPDRRVRMIRSELKRLVDHGRVVEFQVKVEPLNRSAWWEKSTKRAKLEKRYKAVGLLDAVARAARLEVSR